MTLCVWLGEPGVLSADLVSPVKPHDTAALLDEDELRPRPPSRGGRAPISPAMGAPGGCREDWRLHTPKRALCSYARLDLRRAGAALRAPTGLPSGS